MPTRAQIEDVYEGFSGFWSILDFLNGEARTKLYRKYMRLTSLTSLMSLMSQKEEFFLLGTPKRKNSSFWGSLGTLSGRILKDSLRIHCSPCGGQNSSPKDRT